MIHPLIIAAEKLGCSVILAASFDKGKIAGVECFLVSENSNKCEIFPLKTFIGENETEAMDKLYAALEGIFT